MVLLTGVLTQTEKVLKNMSKYWEKFPTLNKLTLDLRKVFGAGYLEVTPQIGPQRTFLSCWGGYSGKPMRDQDFPLIFYGGAK